MISNNILDVATAVDIAQFEHVTVRCNRKLISATSLVQSDDNCPKTLNVPLLPKLNVFSEIDDHDDENNNNASTPATLGKIISKIQVPAQPYFYFYDTNKSIPKISHKQVYIRYYQIIPQSFNAMFNLGVLKR